jgi:hypothetical protein
VTRQTDDETLADLQARFPERYLWCTPGHYWGATLIDMSAGTQLTVVCDTPGELAEALRQERRRVRRGGRPLPAPPIPVL